MKRIRWSEPAAQDLYSITDYIRRNNPDAAREVAATIYEGCESLVNSPYRGRKGSEPDTRELVFSPFPYIAVYRVRESVIEIMRIWHAAQARKVT
jgi:toxin ParE1/3/4